MTKDESNLVGEMVRSGLNAPEPNPTPNTSTPIWDLVIDDVQEHWSWTLDLVTVMRERDQEGRRKYGTPLQAHNGRDALVDAMQEALDLCVYLRQELAEHEGDRIREVYTLALKTAVDLHREVARERAAATTGLPASALATKDEMTVTLSFTSRAPTVGEVEAERDAARRQWCEGVEMWTGWEGDRRPMTPREIAADEGWGYLYPDVAGEGVEP